MQRLFTKNATGIAPDGKWFAGDVNALEDAVAALTDLTQNLEVGSLAIGEAGLQLLRYGAGEARLSGAFRTDGVMRALGGVYAGSFTTTQRDAIANPPYGLLITNSETNDLEMNYGTPAAPSWGSIGTNPPFTTADIANGAITSAKVDETTVAVIPVGGVIDWPWESGSIPAWASLPYGNAVSRAAHPALAALDTASGTPHGVSANNIVLPDYRGRVGAGIDNMGGGAANRITVAVSGINGTTLGAVGGVQGVTLSVGQLAPHNHSGLSGLQSNDHIHSGSTGIESAAHSHADAGHAHSQLMTTASSGSGGVDVQLTGGQGSKNVVDTGFASLGTESVNHTHSFSTGGVSANHNHTIPTDGSGSAHQNVQPTIVVNKIIRVL